MRGVFGLRSEGFAHLYGFGEKTLLSSHAMFLVLIADKFCGGLCGERVEARLVPCLLWRYSPGDRVSLPLLFLRVVPPFRHKQYFSFYLLFIFPI